MKTTNQNPGTMKSQFLYPNDKKPRLKRMGEEGCRSAGGRGIRLNPFPSHALGNPMRAELVESLTPAKSGQDMTGKVSKTLVYPLSILIFLILLMQSGILFAQTNSGISYQAVIRNSNGDLIENDQVGIRFSILHGTPTGNVLYQERHQVQTNQDGLISLIIGTGSGAQGDFGQIDWSAGPRFLQTEVDPDGGSQYTISGVTEMTAVPYAYYAEHVKNTDDADADPLNEIQTLSILDNKLSISQGNEVDLSLLTWTDAQTLSYDSISGELGISGGNKVTLPISSGGDNWGSQHIISDSTLTGNGTSTDPLSVVPLSGSSLWKKESGGGDIYYDEGAVQVRDSFNFSELSAHHFTNMDPDSAQTSHLDNFSLDFNAKDGTYSTGYGAFGAYMMVDSQNLEVNPYRIKFSGDQTGPGTLFTPDSLRMYSQVGLLYPEVATLNPAELRLEWLYTGLKSHYSAGSTTHKNDENMSILNPYQFEIMETTQSTPFQRLHISGDSLQLFNSAKWKTVDIRGDNSIGGQMNLYNLSGAKLSFLGGTDLPGVGGKLCLFTPGQEIEKFCAIATEDFGGELTLFGKEFANFYAGGENNKGHAYVANSNGFDRAGMRVNDDENGVLYTRGGYISIEDDQGTEMNVFGQDGLWLSEGEHPSLVIAKSFEKRNAGYQLIFGENNSPNIYMGFDEIASPGNVGIINLFDGNGDQGASINGMGKIEGRTFLLKNLNGDVTHTQGIYFGGNPYSLLYGPTGKVAVSLSTDTQKNGGEIKVYDKNGNEEASIYVDNAGVSHVVANVKNFRIDHPSDPQKEIWYAAVEGPEAAIYQRGTAKVTNGECFVPFADHFRVILNKSTATVQLTPRHWDTFGLAVTSITDTGFYVKELKGGNGQFEFDWEVKAVRKGMEDFEPVRTKH